MKSIELFAKWIAPDYSISEFGFLAQHAVNAELQLNEGQESFAWKMFRELEPSKFPSQSEMLLAVATFASYVNGCK